jgi:ketosteroid isomerase-like protein
MRFRLAVNAWLVVVSAGCAAAPQVDLDAETAAVAARSVALTNAEAARDVQAATSFWADDAVVQPAGAPQIQGKQAVQELYGHFFASLKEFKGTSTQLTLAASGDLAWEYGVNRMVFSTPNGDVLDNGKYLAVWKKVNGEWYVAALSFTSDTPAPQPLQP